MYSIQAINDLKTETSSIQSKLEEDEENMLLEALGQSWISKVEETFSTYSSLPNSESPSYFGLLYLTRWLSYTPGVFEDFKKLPKACQEEIARNCYWFSSEDLHSYVRLLLFLEMNEAILCTVSEKNFFDAVSKVSRLEVLKGSTFKPMSQETYARLISIVGVMDQSRHRLQNSILLMMHIYAGNEILVEVLDRAEYEQFDLRTDQLIGLLSNWSNLREYPLSWSLELTSNGEKL